MKLNHNTSLFGGGYGIDKNELGAKYNNYGIHGLGIAPATDALAAIKKCILEDKLFTKDELINALGFEKINEVEAVKLTKEDIYKSLKNGEISFEEAEEMLKEV